MSPKQSLVWSPDLIFSSDGRAVFPFVSLGISFCYKVAPQQLEVLVRLLRGRGIRTNFEAMGIGIFPLAQEMLASASCLTNLSLCGVPSVTGDTVEMVS